MKPGDALPQVSKHVTQESVGRYAEASGDLNPLHLDPEFAAGTHYRRVVAHGMLVLAYISEMMTQAFGRAWPESGRLRVRLRAPVYLPAHVTTFGEVRKSTEADGYLRLECSVGCRNEAGEEVINGDASVTIPNVERESQDK